MSIGKNYKKMRGVLCNVSKNPGFREPLVVHIAQESDKKIVIYA